MGETKICRYCGQVIDINAKKCQFCRREVIKEHDNPDLFCKRCKAPVNTDDNFCQQCGAIFDIPSEPLPVVHNMYGIRYNIGIFLTSIVASIAITVFMSSGNSEAAAGSDFITFCIAFIVSEIFLYIYFIPSIIAFENNNPNAYFIYVCNLLFGATIIGWLAALIYTLQTNENA